jgi:hypothetical protein
MSLKSHRLSFFFVVFFLFSAPSFAQVQRIAIKSDASGCSTRVGSGKKTTMTVEELRAYYASVKQMSDFIVQTYVDHDFKVTGETWGIDPVKHRLAANGGLSLVLLYGIPRRFETPLGGWEIIFGADTYTSDRRKEAFAIIQEKLGLELLQPVESVSGPVGGPFGPVYTVTRDLQGKKFTALPVRIPKGNVGDLEMNGALWLEPDQVSADVALWNQVRPPGRKDMRK